MPYTTPNELPNSVMDHLPKHAQEIFKEAFNSALEEYDQEETAFKVAWSAVKKKYQKGTNGDWEKKD